MKKQIIGLLLVSSVLLLTGCKESAKDIAKREQKEMSFYDPYTDIKEREYKFEDLERESYIQEGVKRALGVETKIYYREVGVSLPKSDTAYIALALDKNIEDRPRKPYLTNAQIDEYNKQESNPDYSRYYRNLAQFERYMKQQEELAKTYGSKKTKKQQIDELTREYEALKNDITLDKDLEKRMIGYDTSEDYLRSIEAGKVAITKEQAEKDKKRLKELKEKEKKRMKLIKEYEKNRYS